jgi:hypothetical protein
VNKENVIGEQLYGAVFTEGNSFTTDFADSADHEEKELLTAEYADDAE